MERFWVIRNLQRTGPFSEAQILRAYEQGELQPNDLLWADGVSTPVTVASAFAQLPVPQTKGASEELVLEPIEPQPETVGAGSPYRPPRAAVDDFSASAGGEPRYAGFWVRFSAAMLDSIIVGVAYAILAFALRPLRGMLHLTPGTAPMADFAVQTMLMWLYVALGESGPHSATWGKRAFGLQVLGSDFLDRISFLRASGRFLGRYLSALLLGIGYFMQPFNARKRALHDFLAGTIVVVRRPYSRLLVALMIALGLLVPLGILAAIGIPAYQDYTVRAKISGVLRDVAPATVAIQGYLNRTGQAPGSLEEAGFNSRKPIRGVRSLDFDPNSGELTVTLDFPPVVGRTLRIVPVNIENDKITWGCQPGSLSPGQLPKPCP